MIKNTNGITLIEVLVATGITAVVIVGCVLLLVSNSRQVSSLVELNEITNLHKKYRNCIQTAPNFAQYASSTGARFSVYTQSGGCVFAAIPPATYSQTGNTITYTVFDSSGVPLNEQSKTFYGEFTAKNGGFPYEFSVIETINGPTLNKTFEYTVYQK